MWLQLAERGAPRRRFLRQLYRERRLTAARLRPLDALVAGKLRPTFAPIANPLRRMGRPPLNPANP
jgi:hypothetical protein